MLKKKERTDRYFICRIPPWLVSIIVIVWGYIVWRNYYRAYPVNFGLAYLNWIFSLHQYSRPFAFNQFFPLLLHYLTNLIVLGLFLASANGAGRFLLRKIFTKCDFSDISQKTLFSIGLGLAAIIFLNILLGFTGFFYKSIVLVVLSFFLLGNIFPRGTVLDEGRTKKLFFSGGLAFIDFLLIVAILLAMAINFIGALTPETFYDSLKYHLALPIHWIGSHQIEVIKNFAMSYYPFNLHTLYGVVLMFGDETLAKLIHFSFGFLTILTIFVLGKKYFSVRAGLLAAFTFYTVPLVSLVSWRSAIELGLAFFELLALFAFLEYCQKNQPSDDSRAWLVLAAIFSGIAAGAKPTSLYCVVVIAILIFLYHTLLADLAVLRAFKNLATFTIVAMLVASPWYIRTAILTGNPTYPTFLSLPLKSDFIHQINKGNLVEVNDPGVPDRSLRNFLTLPWNLTLGRKTQEPYAGALFLFSIPFIFLIGRLTRPAKLLALYFFLYYLLWFLVRTYLRYFIPALTVGSLVVGFYLSENCLSVGFKKLLLYIILIMGITNLLFVSGIQKSSMEPLGVLLGVQSRLDYLSTQRPSYPNPYYPVIDWANKNLAKDAGILFLGECRGYYSERKFFVQTIGDFNPLLATIRQGCRSPEELRMYLIKQGITHILVNGPEARRLASYDILDFSPQELKLFANFWKKYVKEIYRDIADISLPERGIFSMKRDVPQWWLGYSSDGRNYVYLYEIMSEEEAGKPHPVPENFLLDSSVYSPGRWEKLKDTVAGLKR